MEHQLEECQDEQRILKTDLTARKELCDKLDNEKDKLNAELNELNDIKRKVKGVYNLCSDTLHWGASHHILARGPFS